MHWHTHSEESGAVSWRPFRLLVAFVITAKSSNLYSFKLPIWFRLRKSLILWIDFLVHIMTSNFMTNKVLSLQFVAICNCWGFSERLPFQDVQSYSLLKYGWGNWKIFGFPQWKSVSCALLNFSRSWMPRGSIGRESLEMIYHKENSIKVQPIFSDWWKFALFGNSRNCALVTSLYWLLFQATDVPFCFHKIYSSTHIKRKCRSFLWTAL